MQSLPEWYRNSVHFTFDNDVVPFVRNAPKHEDATVDVNIEPTTIRVRRTNPVHVDEKSHCQGRIKRTVYSISCLLNQKRYDESSYEILKKGEKSPCEILNKMLKACNHDSGMRVLSKSTIKK